MTMTQATILKKILAHKAEEITTASKKISLKALSDQVENSTPTRGFLQAILTKLDQLQPAIIAEIKKASPSKGLLRSDFDVATIAQSYTKAKATCLSVLTDEKFFQGKQEYLPLAKSNSNLPILRKDFMIDPYQVYEARVMGADCILLIVAALGDAMLKELAQLAHHLDMDVLVEVHDKFELERALELQEPLIGINNRDLHTFKTDLNTTLNLRKQIPEDRVIVTESGIYTSQDVALMRQHQVHSFLVGEAFMRAKNPGTALQQLFNLN